ncbi:helix-turn-helix domain-containing protein [Ruoffia tabacinasalis]|uniref:Helix-turn-helix transcriptional regulator n=1 Tax=Ruoffia tabacinasalis TaxID=87458 RepID=A0ABS0LGD9_9LACT|nr:helix-turn-helix transcriptional regulator [Ruoffia tabacinasalis]MBG9977263.1 helix-turn-helix transcriptional regulator [Ruoffia tabacinasalis]
MLINLENARKEKGITLTQIASVLGLKKYQTISEKIKGMSTFSFDEALKIQQSLFPEYDLIYLFERQDEH